MTKAEMSASSVLVVRAGSPDAPLAEVARLVRTDRGTRIEAHLVDTAGEHGAHWSALVDPAGLLRRLTIRSDGRSAERTLRLTRAPGGPWVADRPDGQHAEPQLAGVDHLVLHGSVASLAVPLLQLVPAAGDTATTAEVELALAALPGLELRRGTVRYRIDAPGERGERVVEIAGDAGEQQVVVDAVGSPVRAGDAVRR